MLLRLYVLLEQAASNEVAGAVKANTCAVVMDSVALDELPCTVPNGEAILRIVINII